MVALRHRFLKWYLLLTLLVMMGGCLYADYQFLGNVQSYKRVKYGILLECDGARVLISVLAPDLIRVRLAPEGTFLGGCSYAMAKQDWPYPDFSAKEEEQEIIITTTELSLRIAKSPCRLGFFDRDGDLINKDHDAFGMGWDGQRVICYKRRLKDDVGDEKY